MTLLSCSPLRGFIFALTQSELSPGLFWEQILSAQYLFPALQDKASSRPTWSRSAQTKHLVSPVRSAGRLAVGSALFQAVCAPAAQLQGRTDRTRIPVRLSSLCLIVLELNNVQSLVLKSGISDLAFVMFAFNQRAAGFLISLLRPPLL